MPAYTPPIGLGSGSSTLTTGRVLSGALGVKGSCRDMEVVRGGSQGVDESSITAASMRSSPR
jgi:hypothetical protein